jgi:arylsulfatase A-like enzyme
MGFWDRNTGGISTPSASWMAELLKAQKAGNDLPPHISSQNAAKLPNPKYEATDFAGHAAWIDGDWKLHRIEGKRKEAKWELYNLETDPNETNDLAERESTRVEKLRKPLEAWLGSVVRSLNGDDYPQQ